MAAEYVVIALTLATLVWAASSAGRWLIGARFRDLQATVRLALSLAAAIAVAVVAVWVEPGMNPAANLLSQLASRDLEAFCAAGLGLSLGLLAALADWRRESDRGEAWLRWAGLAAFAGVLGSLAMFAARDRIRFLFINRGVTEALSDPSETFVVPGYEITLFHGFEGVRPVQAAVGPDGAVYVCHAENFGSVTRVFDDPESGERRVTLFARSLGWVNGLAFHGDDLYVSRTGRYTTARSGRIDEADTGAITVLRDFDGDGAADYYDDVVTGLPGAQDPDPVHQNNGIVISRDGRVFVGIGAHSNAGPNLGEFDGTISTATLDGSRTLEVFARGMRNPFDCAIGPDDALFCTDNDIGFNHSDELNHVVQGKHYGHPYMTESLEPPVGSVEPIWLHAKGSLQGLTYADAEALPENARGRLFVVSYGSGEIFKVDLAREGETYRATPTLFARAPGALDITAAPNGDFYVSCHVNGRVYRIRPE